MRRPVDLTSLSAIPQKDIDPLSWYAEGEAITCGLDADVFELVDCVELPDELLADKALANADPSFDASWDEWFEYLHNSELLLPVEQCCGCTGLLLAWDMRGVRLKTLPEDLLARLHTFFDDCPPHTRALLSHHVFWLVRFERIRRTGQPTFCLSSVQIPNDEQPAFFRPSLLTLRNSGRWR